MPCRGLMDCGSAFFLAIIESDDGYAVAVRSSFPRFVGYYKQIKFLGGITRLDLQFSFCAIIIIIILLFYFPTGMIIFCFLFESGASVSGRKCILMVERLGNTIFFEILLDSSSYAVYSKFMMISVIP